MSESSAARALTPPADRELLEAAVAAAGGVLVDARLRSVHVRAGRSRSQVYAAVLRDDVGEHDVLLVAHVDARSLPAGSFTLTRDGHEVAVWRFPNDPFLPGLPSAVHTGRVRELLDALGAPSGAVSLRTRAYRPGRRAVVEVTLTGGEEQGRVLYLKVLTGGRVERLAEVHRRLRGHLPVPRVLGVAAHQEMLALEALGGATLRRVLVDGGRLPHPEAIVAVSQRLAASGLRTDRDPRAFADPRRHVDQLVGFVPELADEIRHVADEAASVEGPRVPVHGDLHDGQLLICDGGVVGVLDVDGAGTGVMAEDAGNLVAHLEVVGAVWPQAAERCTAYAAEVRDAYRPLVGAPALARATAGAWLALATGPYRAQDAGWRVATRERVRRAIDHLDSDH